MNRILDYTPTDEEIVISRVLVSVHKAVDQHFPDIASVSRQFTKTVFSDDSEATAIGRVPGTDLADDQLPPPPQFRAQDQDRTEPSLKKAGDTDSTAEPEKIEAKAEPEKTAESKKAKKSDKKSKRSGAEKEAKQGNGRKSSSKDRKKGKGQPAKDDDGPSFFSQLDPEPVTDYPSAVQGIEGDQTDWPSVVITGLLVAGLVMLGVVYFIP